MGYRTNFELSIVEGNAPLDEVVETLHRAMGIAAEYGLFNVDDDVIRPNDSMTWYDHDEECSEMSERFPGVVFKLHGEGEEAGDLWNAYYRDGMCQICRGVVTYAPFDPTKLKSVEQAQEEDMGR